MFEVIVIGLLALIAERLRKNPRKHKVYHAVKDEINAKDIWWYHNGSN
jgi:hypothetical protein